MVNQEGSLADVLLASKRAGGGWLWRRIQNLLSEFYGRGEGGDQNYVEMHVRAGGSLVEVWTTQPENSKPNQQLVILQQVPGIHAMSTKKTKQKLMELKQQIETDYKILAY